MEFRDVHVDLREVNQVNERELLMYEVKLLIELFCAVNVIELLNEWKDTMAD